MSKRTKIIVGIVVLLLVAGGVAVALSQAGGGGPEVETAVAAREDLAVTVTSSGKVEAGVSADIFPGIASTIDELYVSDGETVTAGTKIAQLDTSALDVQVAQARAGLAAAEGQLENVGASAGGTSYDIAAARGQVNAASQSYSAAKAARTAAYTAYQNAAKAYDAADAFYPSDSPTMTALKAAEQSAYAGYLQARAGVTSADAAVKAARAGLNKTQAADPGSLREAAEAGVRNAAAALAAAEEALADATLVAPIDGVVVFNNAAAMTGGVALPTEGSAVSPQAAPFTVVDFTALNFTAEIDEADINRVKVGMMAAVALDAFPGEEFESKVTRINPVAQLTSTGGTIFEVEIALTNVPEDILLGMKGDADIEVSSQQGALTIPVEALFSEGGTDFVYVLKAGKLEKTEITVGATTDTEVEVVEGLAEGDVVALSGSTQYTDGMPARAKQ